MLIGGVWTLFSLRNSLLSGVRSGIAAARKGSGQVVAETERDLPMKWMLVALVRVRDPAGPAVPGHRRAMGWSASR